MIGLLFLILFFICAPRYGRFFSYNQAPLFWRWFWGSLVFTAVFISISSVLYILLDARPLVLVAALLLSALPSFWIPKSAVLIGRTWASLRIQRLHCLGTVASGIVLALDGYLLYALASNSTMEAILSPWQIVPQSFWILYGLATALVVFLVTNRSGALRLCAIAMHCFLGLSIAALIYQTGYGFDGFIHRSATETIVENGLIEPKTPYYIGQYTFVTFVHHALGISIDFLNRWLVPFMTATTIPLALHWFLRKKFDLNTLRPLLLLLLIPLPLFISTTPQSFSLIFLFLSIITIISAPTERNAHITGWLFAAASAAVHPLSGIPALVFCLLMSAGLLTRYRSAAQFLVWLISLVTLPAILFWKTGAQLTHFAFWKLPTAIHPPDAAALMQFVYTYKYVLLPMLLVLLLILGIYAVRKSEHKMYAYPLLGLALSMTLNALLLQSANFPLVIAYEQGAFAKRLFFIAGIFLFPVLLHGWVYIAQNYGDTNRVVVRTSAAICIAAIVVASYLAYPRADRIERSKGYSTSAHDFTAVQSITEDANNSSYVVLANQAVSAAAIVQLRFQPTMTLSGMEQFIYPVPTGGPLYPYYLAMVYEQPTKEKAEALKQAAHVDTVYFILNHYWTNAKDIRAIAEKEAKKYWTVQEKIWIYQY